MWRKTLEHKIHMRSADVKMLGFCLWSNWLSYWLLLSCNDPRLQFHIWPGKLHVLVQSPGSDIITVRYVKKLQISKWSVTHPQIFLQSAQKKCRLEMTDIHNCTQYINLKTCYLQIWVEKTATFLKCIELSMKFSILNPTVGSLVLMSPLQNGLMAPYLKFNTTVRLTMHRENFPWECWGYVPATFWNVQFCVHFTKALFGKKILKNCLHQEMFRNK